ncbi:MAG: hypothetical protein IKR92_01255 [Alphaproteobacteria bacterium]|nr:hypothetical protein [Alphaproteobacteria bacterium]
MKKKSLKKYLSAFCLMSVVSLAVYNAQAFMKLDFFAPVADIADKIGKVKTKIETVYNTQLGKLEAKVMKVAGREGAMIFKYVQNNAGAIVTSAAKGQFYAADYTGSGMWEALKSELGDLKLDYAKAQRQLSDYVESREQQKIDKKQAMETELAKMEAEHQALNRSMKELENKGEPIPENVQQRFVELETAIPKMKENIKVVMEKDVTESDTYKKMMKGLEEKQQKVNTLVAKTSEDSLVNMLGQKSVDLFSKKADEEETQNLYNNGLQKFFLGEYEPVNPENVERIMKFRKQEYYKAVKNAMETTITTQTSLIEIEERSLGCTDAATNKAQGIFGASGARICVELQNAKVAARQMELLLAEIRVETTKEMQSWKDKYKMEDYGKDITKFNLDDYVMKKDTLFRKAKNKAKSAINDKITNFDVSSGF